MKGADLTWSEKVAYLCACGLQYQVTRHRWVDVDHQRELREQLARGGPFEGVCPSCGASAQGHASWVELSAADKRAVLVLGAHQRADLIPELSAHLKTLAARSEGIAEWMIRPDWRFDPRVGSVAAQGASAVPLPLGADGWSPSSPNTGAEDAFVGVLRSEDGELVVDLALGPEPRKLWGSAALRARPVLLRLGGDYPVLCVRIVASFLGQTSVIDAVADPASSACLGMFASLGRKFRLQLKIRDDQSPGEAGLCREVAGQGLERNAKLCLESALESLGAQESHQGSFERAVEELGSMGSQARLKTAPTSLAPGAYQHLMMPEETRRALVDLEAASSRENLRHLIEVDALPVSEYEDIRKRVLTASIEQGLCAPVRFWRRVISLGLATDFTGYAQQLAENRQRIEQQGQDDLSKEHALAARADIVRLCVQKQISLPPVLETYLRGAGGSWPSGGSTGAASAGASEDRSGAHEVSVSDHVPESEPEDSALPTPLSSAGWSDTGMIPLDSVPPSDRMDEDMDRLFPRHAPQASVEFMPAPSGPAASPGPELPRRRSVPPPLPGKRRS